MRTTDRRIRDSAIQAPESADETPAASTTSRNPSKRAKSRVRKSKGTFTKNIRIVSFGEDETGRRFVKLRIKAAGRVRTAIAPLDGFTVPSSKVFDLLNSYGAHLYAAAARQELINRVQAKGFHPSRFIVATRLGWHGQDFVLPDRTISPTGRRIRLYREPERPERFDRYRVGGTYQDWRHGAKLIKGNSRMILASCVSLEPVVGPILQTEPICTVLCGPGEIGKSAILVFAGSDWGCHTDPNMAASLGFAVPWDATEFDIEKEALACNHTPMLVDESRSNTADLNELIKMATKASFRLLLGFERGRGVATHRRQSTHVSILTTSNISIEDAPASHKIDDAVRGRWIEVPAPVQGHGMYETLHGDPDIASFSVRLRRLATRHFGHAARKFIKRLSAWLAKDTPGFLQWAEQRRSAFLRSIPQAPDYGQSGGRVHQKFATLYVVGCLAIKFGILPLNRRQLRKALLSCLHDHFVHVGRAGKPPVHSPHELLRRHIQDNPPLDLRTQLLPDIDGYDLRQSPGLLLNSGKHGDEFCISNTRLESIVGGTAAARALKQSLERAGDIATERGGGDARFSVKRTIATRAPRNRHRPNLIAIKPSAVGIVLINKPQAS